MAYTFCTLFDSNYLSRGLALYESLKRHCEAFHLYIFPFDEDCLNLLQQLQLPNVTLVPLSEFEDPELLDVKRQRSRAEYCWTCTASTVLYILDKYQEEMCTYLDADTYFFASPGILLDELKTNSVIITEHRFSPEHQEASATSGKYNVQFMVFKNNRQAKEVLHWWRKACIECCELNPEQGKCGDQKYLDVWTTTFDGIHELQHLGGGVAPWNVDQYMFSEKEQRVYGMEQKTGKTFELVFFHFHAIKFYENNFVQLTNSNYFLSRDVVNFIYKPYVKELEVIKGKICQVNSALNPHGAHEQYERENKNQFFGAVKNTLRKIKQRFEENSRNYNGIYSNVTFQRGEL